MDDDYRKYGTSRAAHMLDNEDPHKCFVCGAEIPDGAIECPKCHFPQNGDEVSQRRFLGDLRVERKDQWFAAFRVNHAFSLLLCMPFNIFIKAVIKWQEGQYEAAKIDTLFAIAFFVIWFWGRKRPFRAFALSLILYGAFVFPVVTSRPLFYSMVDIGLIWPFIFLGIGMVNFYGWEIMSKDLEGKNSG